MPYILTVTYVLADFNSNLCSLLCNVSLYCNVLVLYHFLPDCTDLGDLMNDVAAVMPAKVWV